MTLERKKLGAACELLAAGHLIAKGMKVLARNFRCPLGEIDLVMQDGSALVFVEVKSRRSLSFGPASLQVDWRKQKKLTQLAQLFIKANRLFQMPCRFDVVSVHAPEGKAPSIDHIPNAFRAQ